MKTMNLKFMSMAAIAAMTLCTACSEDDNTPNPEPPVAAKNNSEEYASATGGSGCVFFRVVLGCSKQQCN